jgi:hypothetical protein
MKQVKSGKDHVHFGANKLAPVSDPKPKEGAELLFVPNPKEVLYLCTLLNKPPVPK